MEDTKIYYVGKSKEERLLESLDEEERRIHRIDRDGIELERGPRGKRVKIINGKKIGERKETIQEKEAMKERDNKRKIRNEYKQDQSKYTTREGEKEKVREVNEKFKKVLNKIPRKIKVAGTAVLLATAVSITYAANKAEKENNTQENSVNLTIENGEATIKNLEDMELESEGVQFYTGDVQTKDLQKYKMLLKTTSKETLILDKNKQPIKRMGEDSIVFAKPEIIEKEGKEYLKVICFDNNGMTEGLVKRDELKPSQIYDEGELKDIDKVEIRGTKAKKVMNSDGKHLGEVEVGAETYTTGESIDQGDGSKWKKVIYMNEYDKKFKTGYIKDIYIQEKMEELFVDTEKDGGVDLNIRNEADINGAIIGKAKNKSTIKVVDSSDGDLIIGKDGNEYYQTIIAEKVENSNIKEGIDPLSGDIYVDGIKYTKGYVNADYIALLIKRTELERE